MNRPHPSRRPMAASRWALACGLAVCGGSATAQGPAARLGTVRSVGPVVVRGGSPEAPQQIPPAVLPPGFKPSIFDTFEDRAKAVGMTPAASSQPASVSVSTVGAAPAKPKSAFDTGWQELKGLFAGKPGEPFTPAGSSPANADKNAQAEPSRTVYTGPPAYRWFGWGTTTPGANPHAPNGQYPQASANWYAQTGATPGAFPTQAVQAAAPPAAEPPRYASPVGSNPGTFQPREPEPFFAPPLAPVPVNVPALSLPSGPPVPVGPPIAQSPPSVELPPPNGLFQPPPGPPAAMPVPFVPGLDVQWMPVGARQEPRPELVPTSGWTPAGPSLEEQVRAACKGIAEIVAVQPSGPGRLTVRLSARTESHARVAADEVSRLPVLRGFEVAFEAKFGDR